jgi:hypothetical protein
MHEVAAFVRAALVAPIVPLLGFPLVGCTAELPTFDDDPRPEVCGGAICFAPDQVLLDGDAHATRIRLTRGTGAPCALPRAGVVSTGPTRAAAPIVPGIGIFVELPPGRAGARFSIARASVDAPGAARVRATRVDRQGRPAADEEAVRGEVFVRAIDVATGRAHLEIHAIWSSGVEGRLVIDVEEARTCS